MLFDYDKTSAESILQYAKKLEGQTFYDIWLRYQSYHGQINDLNNEGFENSNAKGQLGNFLEEYYFGYKPNSDQEADFKEAGVELKQTCVNLKKNGEYTAGERLSITNISFDEPIEMDFYKSHVWNKIRLILLIQYLRDKSIQRMFNKILFVNLFTPPKNDLKIIIDDYNKINMKIKAGLAHELSESDTMYLGACTKGATAETSLRPQYYGNHVFAKKRNFCFKRSYMDYVLHTYVLKDMVPYEPILSDSDSIQNKSFENIIIERIATNFGKSDEELCSIYDREYNNNKVQWADLVYRMLGIKGNHAQEFQKANIVVKVCRIEENNKIREKISFPTFKFKDLIQQKWEDSEVFEYFDQTRFLFVLFKRKGDKYYLDNCKFWNMPYEDLNITVHNEWENIKHIIADGVKFSFKETKSGLNVQNNIPGVKDSQILHIRPHSSKSAYKLHSGFERGNILSDANELPNGEYMTTQSFWINNEYILNQLK